MVTIQDARYRMKVYLDTYITDANLTADDDATELVNAVMYAYPPYPLDLEFIADYRTGRNPYDIIDIGFFIDKPTAKARYSSARTIYGYEESIPIHVHCVDRPGVTSELLLWKAEDELRTVLSTYPEQVNWRFISETKDNTLRFGATTVHGFTLTISYVREST